MELLETFYTAQKALLSNKVRTFLTMLGVIIGVFSVILLVALVTGVQNYITNQFDELGSNLVFITAGRSGINQDPAQAFTDNKLNESQIDLIEQYAGEYIEGSTPYIAAGMTVSYKTKEYYGAINAANQEFSNLFNIGLSKGRYFTAAEEKAGQKVAVIGHDVFKKLFVNRNPIDESIKIDGHSFRVIGVVEPKGADYDELIVIPLSTAKKVLNLDQIAYLAVKIRDDVDVDVGTKKVELAMLQELKKDDFTILSQKDLLSSIDSILGILSVGLAAVAAISLLVGGIGIMNIMLVSVTERISEIGLRKALGATPTNIGLQFMIEAITLSLGGGLIGISLGFLGTFISKRFIDAEVPWWSVIVSLLFSIVVGVIFGTYPAIKASKKDPIEALRYE
ncbi:FtsX-like permease family protein [candidate division WWE3 bacterium]|jgi:putative ABC transport system permease protein|uniref:FtsX-like permease family protein n=1 Tax=candidate division WWE3 bacterium TaxID=2053526 RepID=A0A3A4ZB87_UNCKA|nr:MAG: FtsX-like permease family protein [candidate division WWE3 bacterium]